MTTCRQQILASFRVKTLDEGEGSNLSSSVLEKKLLENIYANYSRVGAHFSRVVTHSSRVGTHSWVGIYSSRVSSHSSRIFKTQYTLFKSRNPLLSLFKSLYPLFQSRYPPFKSGVHSSRVLWNILSAWINLWIKWIIGEVLVQQLQTLFLVPLSLFTIDRVGIYNRRWVRTLLFLYINANSFEIAPVSMCLSKEQILH